LTAQEEQHLQLLVIFHYIVGGLAAFFACFPLIHLTIGLVMVFGGFPGNQAPPAVVGWLFIILGGGFFLSGKVSQFALSAGRFLAQRKHYPFIFGVACANVFLFRSERCWACLRSFALARIGARRLCCRKVAFVGGSSYVNLTS
jgi:hypothetical protein